MKKTLLVLAAVAMASSAFAQGTLGFSSIGGADIIRDPIVGANDVAGGAGVSLSVSLFLASDTAFANPLATSNFVDGTGWINPPENLVVVPGSGVNATASFIVRGFETGKTWESSAWQGQSAAFNAGPLGGPNAGAPATPPPDLANLQAFTIREVPEPTTIAFGAVGIGALLLRRRSK